MKKKRMDVTDVVALWLGLISIALVLFVFN